MLTASCAVLLVCVQPLAATPVLRGTPVAVTADTYLFPPPHRAPLGAPGILVRLAHVDAPHSLQQCRSDSGGEGAEHSPCGESARFEAALLIASGDVRCVPAVSGPRLRDAFVPADRMGAPPPGGLTGVPSVATAVRCTAPGVSDLAARLVADGLAVPHGAWYRREARFAQATLRGLYAPPVSGRFLDPSLWLARTVATAERMIAHLQGETRRQVEALQWRH